MAMEIVGARPTENGLAVTFVTDTGMVPLEGTPDELSRLATVMQQVAVLAPLNERERIWIEDVRVGDSIVRLGLRPGGEALVRIIRLRPPTTE
jgi:hypothetical protein